MERVKWLLSLIGVLALAGAGLAACGGDDDASGNVEVPEIAACGDLMTGSGDAPDSIIVSDLPLKGDSAGRSSQMNDAITQVLHEAGWKAGDRSIGFMACDDSDPDSGLWTEEICKENAEAYVGEDSIIGVIGTYNSGCAAEMIPILNEAEGGSLAMVSPGNTLICLTEPADTCADGQPESLYPTGDRNYARVVPNDAAQGAGLVTWAAENGMKRVAVLQAAGDETSLGQAATFVNAAETGGVEVVAQEEWDPEADDYRGLMNQVKGSNPDAVLLAGLTEQNGGQLIKDKVAVLGSNDQVGLLAPDGFAQQSTIDAAGAASKGMFATVPGRAPELLGGTGKAFVEQLASDLGDEPVEIYAPYAGQAAQVLLDAIEAGGDDRQAVASALFGIEVEDGITGDFTVTDSGDPSVGPVTVSEAGQTFKPVEVIEPKPALVEAARGEG